MKKLVLQTTEADMQAAHEIGFVQIFDQYEHADISLVSELMASKAAVWNEVEREVLAGKGLSIPDKEWARLRGELDALAEILDDFRESTSPTLQ